MAKRVAVVTGSNKGIGFGVVRALCKQFDGDVFLTSRDEARGKAAVQCLEAEGLNPKYHQLDITDHSSIVRLRDFLLDNYHGLDVLVNNAAVFYWYNKTIPFPEKARVTIATNFTGTLDVCNVLFPLLRSHARVSNVSSLSSANALSHCSEAMKTQFTNPSITMDELISLMDKFVKSAENGTTEQEGFYTSCYGMSKIGMNVMSRLHQEQMDKEGREDVVVNACCPGYVNTDMIKGAAKRDYGPLTIDQGAETPVYLALLPPNVAEPRGQFLTKKKIRDWTVW